MQNQQKIKFRKDDFIMKKFKKIIAMGCAAVMAMSVMCVSAFAADNESLDKNEVVEYNLSTFVKVWR